MPAASLHPAVRPRRLYTPPARVTCDHILVPRVQRSPLRWAMAAAGVGMVLASSTLVGVVGGGTAAWLLSQPGLDAALLLP